MSAGLESRVAAAVTAGYIHELAAARAAAPPGGLRAPAPAAAGR